MVAIQGQTECLRIQERDFLRQVHQGERECSPTHKQPQITHVAAEDTLDTPEDITQRTKNSRHMNSAPRKSKNCLQHSTTCPLKPRPLPLVLAVAPPKRSFSTSEPSGPTPSTPDNLSPR